MEISALFIVLVLHALYVFHVRLVALGAAAPQQIPRYDSATVSQHPEPEQQTLHPRFYPYEQTLNGSSLPVEPEGQTYILGPSMTINGNLLVPDILTGGKSLPLLLDTLSACTWLPTTSLHCFSSTAMGNDSDVKQGDDCHGVSVVAVPVATSNSTVQKHISEGSGQTARVACGHYLAGALTGPLLHTDLNVAGETVKNSKVLFADRFYAPGNITLHSFAQYYGGAVGVLGMGLYEPMFDEEAVLRGEKQFSNEIVSGVLRNFWLQQDSTGNKSSAELNSTAASNKIWSMALPRWDNGEEGDGRLVIGGLVSNETAETTGHELSVPLSPYAEGEGLVWKKSYAFDRVSFSTGNISADATQQEEYFLDSAMSIVYTSRGFAAEVASLFSPPGVYDNTTGLFGVNCNATAPSSISFNIDNGRGGKMSVPMFPGDLIVPWPLDNRAGGTCMSGFQNDRGQPDWRRLGWPFFRNVVLTVDVGQWEANISARVWPEKPPAPSIPSASTSPSTTTSAASDPQTSTSLSSSPTGLPPPSSSITPSTITIQTTKPTTITTVTQITSLPTTTPLPSTSTPTTANDDGGVSVSPISPSQDTLSIAFPKTITAGPSAPAAGESDSFVSPFPVSTSSEGPAGLHKRAKQEGEARSVADEESGIKGWWADRRGRARARARDGMWWRWWPVSLVRRGGRLGGRWQVGCGEGGSFDWG